MSAQVGLNVEGVIESIGKIGHADGEDERDNRVATV